MLAEKVIVVTGASSGIGEAVARRLGREGASLVLGARRGGLLARVAEDIDPSRERVIAVPTDVTDRRQAERLVATAVERFGRLDVLINNAGRGHLASVEDTTDEMIENMFAVNTFALWYTARPALRVMKRQGSGHVITVASMAGKVGFPFNSAYVAAKHAAVGFSHALRLELLGTPLLASVVCPGGVDTAWARVTEGAPMLPLFSESGPIIKRIVAERGASLPEIEGVISPDRVAAAIYECILQPAPEVFTHRGSKEFAQLAAVDRQEAERLQAPIVEGERAVYESRHA
jgi:NAD(P)-dependent dehydrogenase (short-subunit alcohol dehydrogenase family)